MAKLARLEEVFNKYFDESILYYATFMPTTSSFLKKHWRIASAGVGIVSMYGFFSAVMPQPTATSCNFSQEGLVYKDPLHLKGIQEVVVHKGEITQITAYAGSKTIILTPGAEYYPLAKERALEQIAGCKLTKADLGYSEEKKEIPIVTKEEAKEQNPIIYSSHAWKTKEYSCSHSSAPGKYDRRCYDLSSNSEIDKTGILGFCSWNGKIESINRWRYGKASEVLSSRDPEFKQLEERAEQLIRLCDD